MQDDTREQLLETATKLFADRGFYGASLANIADELGLTKQALLHHFGRKEKLYAEILARISERMMGFVQAAKDASEKPNHQLLATLLSMWEFSLKAPHEIRIIMRELLDNERRANQVHSWYLKPFLDALIQIVRAMPAKQRLSKTDALSRVYPMLGAMSYFIVSDVVLQQMYGKTNYSKMQKRYSEEIDRQVRDLIKDLS